MADRTERSGRRFSWRPPRQPEQPVQRIAGVTLVVVALVVYPAIGS